MIRLGFFDEAEAILNAAAGDRLCDPDALNLLGFIAESRRSWTTARQWYGKALRADPAHTAAQHNLRRLYEMQTFGRGDSQRASFGDEHPALNELLNARRADPVDADAAPPPTPPPCEHSGITPVH